jgi:hypothetical protein
MMQKQKGKARVFSIELKSKRNLKNVTLTNDSKDTVLLEGTIGELVLAKFAEGIVFEVKGTEGVLRVDLGEEEIQKASEETGGENQ